MTIKIQTKRWVYSRSQFGWSLINLVTGELVLWKGMFGLQRCSKRPFRNFIRCIRGGWKLWFFGEPWDCRFAETDDFYYRDGEFIPADELRF